MSPQDDKTSYSSDQFVSRNGSTFLCFTWVIKEHSLHKYGSFSFVEVLDLEEWNRTGRILGEEGKEDAGDNDSKETLELEIISMSLQAALLDLR